MGSISCRALGFLFLVHALDLSEIEVGSDNTHVQYVITLGFERQTFVNWAIGATSSATGGQGFV